MVAVRWMLLCVVLSAGLLQGKHTFAVPTYKQRQAIERLSAFNSLNFDPFSTEIQQRKDAKQAEMIRVLSKKSDDLTPFEQFDLLRYTFPVKTLDPFVGDVVWFFFLSYALQASEYYFHAFVSQSLGLSSESMDMRLDVPDEKGPDPIDVRQKKSFDLVCGVRAVFPELRAAVVSTFGGSPECEIEDKIKQSPPETSDTRSRHELDIKEVLRANKVFSAPRTANGQRPHANIKPIQARSFLDSKKIVRYLRIQYKHYPYPGQAIIKKFGIGYFVKIWPIIKRFISFYSYHKARLSGKTYEMFEEHIMKHISPEVVEELRSDENKALFMRKILCVLWENHGGDSEKIFSELASLYEKLEAHEPCVVQEKNDLFWYQQAVQFHSNFTKNNKLTINHALSRGFEHGVIRRLFYTIIATVSCLGMGELYRMFVKQYFIDYLITERRGGPIMANKFRRLSCVMFALLTVWSCWSRALTYKNVQAERDYQVFLLRQGLQNDQHAEKFYWGWFLPEWKMKKKDLLAVEKEFKSYVDTFSQISTRVVEHLN